jgi:DNA replication protein DnaC
MWRNVSVLPVNMRWSRLRDLQPYQQSPCPVDEQQKALDVMKANRHRSYLIVGPSSAGKTHLAAAIYSERVVEWVRSGFGGSCPATFIDTNTMLSQWMERNSNENAPAPTVTPGRVASIVARKLQPVLVLDDLDKIVVTAPRMAKLAEIVKFYDDADSQIVATSCLSPYDLANRWAEHGGDSTLNKILKRGTWVPLSAAE